MDVVEAVSHRELIAGAQLMIDLAEEVAVVNRIRIEAGGDLRSLKSQRGKAPIDGVHVRLRNRHQAGLIQAALFEIGEVEAPVTHQRSSQTGAILRLSQWQLGMGERIGRIEALITKVAVYIAMHGIRAALGDHV